MDKNKKNRTTNNFNHEELRTLTKYVTQLKNGTCFHFLFVDHTTDPNELKKVCRVHYEKSNEGPSPLKKVVTSSPPSKLPPCLLIRFSCQTDSLARFLLNQSAFPTYCSLAEGFSRLPENETCSSLEILRPQFYSGETRLVNWVRGPEFDFFYEQRRFFQWAPLEFVLSQHEIVHDCVTPPENLVTCLEIGNSAKTHKNSTGFSNHDHHDDHHRSDNVINVENKKDLGNELKNEQGNENEKEKQQKQKQKQQQKESLYIGNVHVGPNARRDVLIRILQQDLEKCQEFLRDVCDAILSDLMYAQTSFSDHPVRAMVDRKSVPEIDVWFASKTTLRGPRLSMTLNGFEKNTFWFTRKTAAELCVYFEKSLKQLEKCGTVADSCRLGTLEDPCCQMLVQFFDDPFEKKVYFDVQVFDYEDQGSLQQLRKVYDPHQNLRISLGFIEGFVKNLRNFVWLCDVQRKALLFSMPPSSPFFSFFD